MESKYFFLSRKDKEKGKKNYIVYTFINGLSYSFLAETIIYLMALNFGASNIQLGYISSAVYLTGAIVFFVPIIFPRVKIIKLFFVAWLLRGVVSLMYGLTPFLSEEIAVWIIILVYTLYSLLRNIAYPLNHVIQGCITKPAERSDYASLVITILYASMMLSRFISFSSLSFFGNSELLGLLFLIGLGILLNTASSFAIKNVPVKDIIPQRNVKESLAIFKQYLKQKQSLLLIILYCGGMSLFVLFNFSVPFLTKEIHISSSIIFIYTMINFVGVILASRIARPFMDRFGSKPLLIIANVILIGLSIIWSLCSAIIPAYFFFILGFISMFFIGMIRMLLDRLIINSIPEADRIGFTSSLAVVFSIVSLVIGLVGGAVADLPFKDNLNLNNEYTISFIIMAALCLINFTVLMFLKEKGSLSARSLVYSIINSKHRKTIHSLDKLKRSGSWVKKQMILVEIESNDTDLATAEIKKRLKISNLKDKEMVLRSLFSNPRPELLPDLLEEAKDRHSWWRQGAVFALGAYDNDEASSVLRKVFREKYPYMRSIAAKSMARLNDFTYHNEINELLSSKTLDVRTYINLIIAVSLMEHDGSYWSSIFRLIKEHDSFRFHQSLLNIGSTRMQFSPSIEDIFYEMNCNEAAGFNSIFEELFDIELTDEEIDNLTLFIKSQDYYSIWSWCSSRCKKFKLTEPYEQLRYEITHFRKKDIKPSVALAGLYFTLQLELQNSVQKSNVNRTGKVNL